MGARAGIVVTGTEVLTGRVADRNGPWLAEELRQAGVDVANIVVVGDRPEDLAASLQFLVGSGVDLILTSGGLGPTADDLTAEVVASVQGRAFAVDADLAAQIAAIVDRLSAGRGWGAAPEATAAANRKQAMVPAGASILTPVGTAPGLVVPAPEGTSGPPIVVLPGPPRELQGMWPAALAHPLVQVALADRAELRQSTLRIWGTPEQTIAATLRKHESILAGLEITTCLRDAELEVVTRYAPDAQPAYDALIEVIRAEYAERAYSLDGRTIDEIVATALIERGATIGTAEALAGATVVGRMLDRPGASKYLRGGVIPYANAPKRELLGLSDELMKTVGSVSAEAAQALAEGARTALHTDVGVGITGMAGPVGTALKPVGLVYLCVVGDGAAADPTTGQRVVLSREIKVPGSRTDIGARAVAIAMHMVRELLVR
jgi:nicotinamide-nucleotide amidase